MEQVKRLEKVKANYYKVFLESGKTFHISEDVLVRYRLLKGTELNAEQVAEITLQTQLDHGYQLALNYLSYQLRTKKEMRDYLLKKEITPENIPAIMKRLVDLKLVDDLVYGQSYVRTQARLGDKGPRVIREKLMQKGVSELIIDESLEEYPFESQLAVAKKVAEKAERKYERHSHTEKQRKIKQYLMSKGFSGDIITESLQALALEKDEEVEEDLLTLQGDKLWRKNQRFDAKKRKQKVTQSLYQKGFSFDLINDYIRNKEMEEEDGVND